MDKKELRSFIKTLKKQHSKESLLEQSQLILSKLENHQSFVEAETVMLYSSLPDEVDTHDFLERWRNKKRIILPTVVGDDIIPVELSKETDFAIGDFNILEPQNEPYNGNYDLLQNTSFASSFRPEVIPTRQTTDILHSENSLSFPSVPPNGSTVSGVFLSKHTVNA